MARTIPNSDNDECSGCGSSRADRAKHNPDDLMLRNCPECGSCKCTMCDMGDDVECLGCPDDPDNG